MTSSAGKLVFAAAAALWIPTGFSAVDVASCVLGKSPVARIVTFGDTAAGRGFSWETDPSVGAGEVRLVPGEATPGDFASAALVFTGTCTVVTFPTAHCHRVTIDALEPGRYSYRLGADGNYAYGRIDVRKPADCVTAVNFNDFQMANPSKFGMMEGALAAARRVVGGADGVDFLLNGGDFVDGGLWRPEPDGKRVRVGRSIEWALAGDLVGAYFPGVPLVSASGNHDFGDYSRRLPLRRNKGCPSGCESIDYGNVHLVALPFASVGGRGEGVFGWLDRDLAASRERGTSDWTILCMHWGPNTTGDHGALPAVSNLVFRVGELCTKHRVDLVLQAHDHTFSKTLPYRWSGRGWTMSETDDAAVNLRPRQVELDGELYDDRPEGTYYLSAGCAGHRVGENASFATPKGKKTFRNRAYKVVVGALNVDSKWGKKGDPASADLPRSMFGVLRVNGLRLAYDWYVVDSDGSFARYDTLRIRK